MLRKIGNLSTCTWLCCYFPSLSVAVCGSRGKKTAKKSRQICRGGDKNHASLRGWECGRSEWVKHFFYVSPLQQHPTVQNRSLWLPSSCFCVTMLRFFGGRGVFRFYVLHGVSQKQFGIFEINWPKKSPGFNQRITYQEVHLAEQKKPSFRATIFFPRFRDSEIAEGGKEYIKYRGGNSVSPIWQKYTLVKRRQ